MNSPRLKMIFSEALVRQQGSERATYLDEACRGDSELRAQVETLLDDHDHIGRFLGTAGKSNGASGEATGREPGTRPTGAIERDEVSSPCSATAAGPGGEGPGTILGPYRLVRQIGEGGMGVVFMAEQLSPVKRTVALKLIRAGMDSKPVLARFDAERQALALMDHPNIARVLDAGTTDKGQPYFVMELVPGVPITRYCDDNLLSPRQRLELFMPVCRAIQHAHQKGIIHRDIKPSNVLVTLRDGKPVSKVIDFGVAKATSQRLTERTLLTLQGTMVGTLEYMSPEQAEMSASGVDTRSDIYSLGALLYELLTGSTPLTHKRIKAASFGEVLRMIKEEEPPRPSTRLSTSREALASISARRRTESARLALGELDWIVMKALEKDRNRRYQTVDGLAEDLRRHLDGEPVQACPPSAWYGLRKWVWRNHGLVLGGAMVLLALVLGVLGTSIGLWYANEARGKAVAAERHADERRREAESQTALANAVKEFLKRDVLRLADPATQPIGAELDYNADMKLRDVVLWAAGRIEGRFANQPLVEAEIRHTLGVTLLNMGRADLAVGQLERVRRLQANHLDPDHPDALAAMTDLAGSHADMGRHTEALKLREEVLALRIRKLGPDHPDTLTSMSNLTISYRVLGRLADALKLREETLARRSRVLGSDHLDTLWSMNNLANIYADVGRRAEALKLREDVRALRTQKLGRDHPDTLLSITNLANSYSKLGRDTEALELREEMLTLRIRKLGPDHPDTLWTMNDLATSYADVGRRAEALELHEKTLARRGRVLGPEHLDTLRSAEAVIRSLFELERAPEALPKIDKMLAASAKATQSGRYIDPGLIPRLFEFRIRVHRTARDAGGCRTTARMWEQRDPRNARGMYNAARFWAIAAAAQAHGACSDSTRLADLDADRAMTWLTKAFAAGLEDGALMKSDTDLGFLHQREDFQRLAIAPRVKPN